MNRTNKRFYWLKLPDDFFDRNDIKIIESQKNGEKYVLFYLKLLTAAIEHTGKLRFNESIPFTEEMLATVTNTDIDVVRSSMKLFQNLDLIEIDDEKTIHMIEVPKMLGSETASTIRSRKSRAKKKKLSNVQEQKALQCNTYATNCNGDIDIEIYKQDKLKDKGEKFSPVNQDFLNNSKDFEIKNKNNHFLTNEVITNNLISNLDYDVNKFNELFDELDANHDRDIVLKTTRYMISFILKKGVNSFDSIYAYFSKSIRANIENLETNQSDYLKESDKEILEMEFDT